MFSRVTYRQTELRAHPKLSALPVNPGAPAVPRRSPSCSGLITGAWSGWETTTELVGQRNTLAYRQTGTATVPAPRATAS